MIGESVKLWRHRNNGIKLREQRRVVLMRIDRVLNVSSRRVSSESRSSFSGVRTDYFTGADRSHVDLVQRRTAKTESGVYCVCLLGFIYSLHCRFSQYLCIPNCRYRFRRLSAPVSASPVPHIHIVCCCM